MPGLTTLIIVAEYVAVMVASMALSYVVSSLTTPDGLKGSTQTDPGVRAQVPPDTTNPMPVVYGSAYVGGRFVDACITTNQAAMFYVHAISCVSPNGQFTFDQTKFYYGDRLITFDATDRTRVVSLTDGAGNVDTAINASNGLLRIWLYTSSPAGVITPLNSSSMPWAGDVMGSELLPSELRWTSTGRTMNGLAFAVIYLEYSREAGTTQLQPITYHCSHTLYGAGVAKPGDVWYDYMTNNVYGAAVEPEFVDTTSRTQLNAYSDELITFNNYSGVPTTQPRYRINGVIDTSKAVLKNIDDIMQACDSWLRYEATTGLWSVTINKAESVSLALNDDNIIGSISVGTVDLAQTVNVIEAKFPDSTNRDQYNYVNESVPTALLYPNEPVNKQTVTYELVNDSVQALYLANRVLEQAREDLTVTVNTTYKGIQLSAGDVVSITNDAYGWEGKLFRCMQVQESVTQDNSLGATLQLSEYNAQVYDNFDITQFTPEGNTNNPSNGFFSSLYAPVVSQSHPYEAVPSFVVDCVMPTKGRVNNVTLFYTTVATPTANDWQIWGTQSLPNSQPYGNGETISFSDINIPAGTYYFAYKVGNESYSSQLSPKSVSFAWDPSPGGASTFILTFSPATVQVPYVSGAPVFTGISYKLYGSNNAGPVDFVTAQTDADASFVNNTWRIGDSESTGYGAITKSGITINNPTDGGSYAQFGEPLTMPGSPATVTVPARYKDSAGKVHAVAASTIQFVYSTQGANGNQVATASLYQWSTSVPSSPNGSSTYTWATGTNSAYTGGNGWSTTVGSNPGTPLLQLYSATKQITATATATTTTVDWTVGVSIQSVGINGAAGIQQASPTVYQWAITIPSAPVGTSSYTWASDSFTPVPSEWSATPGTAPSAGYTLWGAAVSLVASATVTTSTINWTTASITARGYAGTSGTNGASARICYSKTTLSSLASTPATITTSGSGSFPPNGSWGWDTVWQATAPAITAGESVYQSDGVYTPSTGNTVWNVPYLSALKVGSLSAITTNTGNLTVTGTIQASTAAISGTTMTGSGMVVYNSGQFAVGSSSNNITYNNSTITINGALVGTNNILANSVTAIQTTVNLSSIGGTSSYYPTNQITLTNNSNGPMQVTGTYQTIVYYSSIPGLCGLAVDRASPYSLLATTSISSVPNEWGVMTFTDTIPAGQTYTYNAYFWGESGKVTFNRGYFTGIGYKR